MTLLQRSIAGGVMILFILAVRALTVNRLPKKTFLALWAAAWGRLLLPFSLPFGLSIYSLLDRAPSPAAAAPTPASPAIPAGQAAISAPMAVSASAGTFPLWEAVWLAGMVLCTTVFAVAYWKCYREFQMSPPVENGVVQRWLRDHPLRRRVSIRQSDRISSPLTFSVLRPVILMPKGTDWTDEAALQYVLEHEWVHIQRFDTVSKLLLIAAACVHWFNPLVWAMYLLANRDLELSCDETVVRRFGSGARASYARVLIRMEETRSGFTPPLQPLQQKRYGRKDHSDYENEKNNNCNAAAGSGTGCRDGDGLRHLGPSGNEWQPSGSPDQHTGHRKRQRRRAGPGASCRGAYLPEQQLVLSGKGRCRNV